MGPPGRTSLLSLRQTLRASLSPRILSPASYRLPQPVQSDIQPPFSATRCVPAPAKPPSARALQSVYSGWSKGEVVRRVEASAMDVSGVESAPMSHNAGVSPSASSAIQFLTLCQRLKTTKRTGWVNHGVKESESIADHMYRMAVMAIIATDVPGVNKDRCVKMAVVHDIAEAIVGDITPSDGIPKEEKNRLETAAINEMCEMLGGGFQAEDVRELWQEYENNTSPEAKLVKDFDKLEMILQALEYETEQGKDLEDFFQSTKGKFQTDLGKAWAAEIVSRRKQRSQGPQEPMRS